MNQPKQVGPPRLPAMIAFLFLTILFLSSISFTSASMPPSFVRGVLVPISLTNPGASMPPGAVRGVLVPPDSIPFSFTLTTSARTSAGVYTQDSVLVRTLWSGVTYAAGTHTGAWDGRTDEGQLAANGNYYIKVLSNNVNYTWEGTIGNNSDANTGPTVQRGFDKISGMAIAGQYAYYCKNYSEGNPSQLKLNLANPRSRIQIMPAGEGTGQATNFVATDGNYVYWAGYDARPTIPYYFVFATRVSNDSEVFFPAGRAYKAKVGRTYGGAIDTINNDNGVISGLAVQPSGNFLFVAHRVLNELHVLNKTTGALVQTLSYTDAGALAVDSANNLWMAYTSGGSPRVEKFTVDTSGALTTTGIILSGLVAPLAIAAAPDQQTIVVADGGASQQLKAYNLTTGAAAWTYGQAGGYATGPAVSNDKFYWSETRGVLGTFIAFQSDSTFWVGDAGNNRAQHFSFSRTFLDNIMYVPHFYSSVVDPNNTTRVFADYVEYQVDYSKPLGHANGSWTLIRNWGYNVPATHDDHNNRLRCLTTLSNGRTYALLLYTVTAQTQKWEVVELPASGNLRFTGIYIPFTSSQLTQLYPDGSLRKMTRLTALGQVTTWSKKTLTGFNASFNPVWSSDTVIATAPPATKWDPGFTGNVLKVKTGEITASNVVLAFDGGKALAGFENFHLGGVKLGANNKWLWRTAMVTHPKYTGPFPPTGDYDIGNSVMYAGVAAMALDRNIFWGYHGEFWKNSQTNKWNHVYDNGLFVGQFGTTGPAVAGQEAPPGMAGNAYAANLVKINDTIYLYHNDEGHHGGIHRWRITGLGTIQQQTAAVNINAAANGLLASYFDGTQLNNVYHRQSRIDSTVHIDHTTVNLTDTTKFSVSWTGYIQPLYNETYRIYTNTDEGVRLWVNGKLFINHKDTTGPAEYSDTIALKAGLRYPVRMEFFQRSGAASASLLWSSASQAKAPIPYAQLYPAAMPDYSGGYDLLANLPFHAVLENNMYGWTRNPVTEDNTNQYTQWRNFETSIKTNERVNSPDLYLKYVNKTPASSWVSRDLGNVTDSTGGWQLAGRVNYEGNAPNEDAVNLGISEKGGSFLEVLDDSSKVVLRFFWNMAYNSNLCRLYANNQVIASGTAAAMSAIYNTAQPISITCMGDSLTVQYGPFAAVTTARLDTTARGHLPKTMRCYFWTDKWNGGRAIDFEKMKFMTIPANQDNQSAQHKGQLLVQDLFGKQEQPGALKVYPNPSNGTALYMRYQQKGATMLKLRITDLSGKDLHTRIFPHNPQGVYSIRFNKKLSPGIYLVIINDRVVEKIAVY